MWAIAGCMLLATSALATKYAPYTGLQDFRNPPNYAASGAVYPIDYNDDLNIKNPLIKPGNLIYTFEQIRRDQPPQVENREEALGKYMYRKPKLTTTTMRVPEMIPVVENFPVQIPDSRQISRQDRYPAVNTWQPMPRMLATTATPTVPALANFNDFSLDVPTEEINPQARYPPVQKWASREMPPPPPPPSPKWEEYPQAGRPQPHTYVHPEWNYQSQPKQPVVESQWPLDSYHSRVEEVPSTPQPHWTEIAARAQQEPAVHRQVGAPRSAPTRGNHKFNWNDVQLQTSASNLAPAPLRPTTPAPALPTLHKKGPPPAVPTLTPWSGDNFRK